MAQLSKSRHQLSICRGVTRARLVDERGQHPRFVNARFPEGEREFVIASEPLRQHADVGHGHAKRVFGENGVTRHAITVAFAAMALQPR